MASNMEIDRPCTEKCRSTQHGSTLWSIGCKGSEKEILALWNSTCTNYGEVKDQFGRTCLMTAATYGYVKLADWLIKQKGSNINAKDSINGYTPLHRAILYGNIDIARNLIKHNANMNIQDNEGLSPLDLWLRDRNPKGSKISAGLLRSDPTDLFVYGTNVDYTLGDRASKTAPESLELLHSKNIKQVEISTYHAAYLAQNGTIFTCGRGNFGQTGHGDEKNYLQPTKIGFKEACARIALGPSHTIFLMENGSVKSCGSNEHAVLGYEMSPPNIKQLTPRFINLDKGNSIISVCTSMYHSVVITSKRLFSFGTNLGQLGHKINLCAQKFNPSFVNLPVNDEVELENCSCNEIATVVRTKGTDIILFYKNETKRINLKKPPSKVLLVPIPDSQNLLKRVNKTESEITFKDIQLCMFILFMDGQMVIWREQLGSEKEKGEGKISKIEWSLTKLCFGYGRYMKILNFCLNRSSILFLNNFGEGFKCDTWTQNKPFVTKNIFYQKADKNSTDWGVVVKKVRDTTFSEIKLEFVKLKRIPNIYFGLSINSDPKGNNIAIIQMDSKNEFLEVPLAKPSTMLQDLEELLLEAPHHDLEFQVGLETILAHRYIVESRAPNLLDFKKSTDPTSGILTVQINEVDLKVFHQVLKYIYTNQCDMLLKDGFKEENNSKLAEYVKGAMAFAKRINLQSLRDKLRRCWFVEGRFDSSFPGISNVNPPLIQFNRTQHSNSYDIILRSQDNLLIPAHRSILIARLEYFQMMLYSHSWLEAKSQELSLPCSGKALEILIDYIYLDEITIKPNTTIEFLFEILAMSDQFLIERLKTIAEIELSNLIQTKNVADIFQISWIYNSKQLQTACMHYITQNLGFILECRLLDRISNELMKELSEYYKGFIAPVRDRVPSKLRSSSPDGEVYQEALEELTAQHPEMLLLFDSIEDFDQIVAKKVTSKSIRIKGRRTLSTSESEEKGHSENNQVSTSAPTDNPFPEPLTSIYSSSPSPPPKSTSHSPPKEPRGKLIVPLPSMQLNTSIEEFPGLFEETNKHDVNQNSITSPKSKDNPRTSFNKKKTKWKPLSADPSGISSSPPSSSVPVSSRDPTNPWTFKSPSSSEDPKMMLTSSPRDSRLVFDEIQKEEEERKENSIKILSKSLVDKQIEDKAMGDLKKFYTTDAVIKGVVQLKVERVCSDSYANPIWPIDKK